MSQSHHHDSHGESAPAAPMAPLRLASNFTDGGHEIDVTPNRNLFAFLGVMTVLMIASAVFIYQLFVGHTGDQLSAAANVRALDLQAKIERDTAALTTWGKTEKDGVVGYRMPVAEAKKRILENPALFAPAAPPADWTHPDDAK
jgi:hypothetical protein